MWHLVGQVEYCPDSPGSPVAGEAAAFAGRFSFVRPTGGCGFLPGPTLIQFSEGTVLWAMSVLGSSRRPGAAQVGRYSEDS